MQKKQEIERIPIEQILPDPDQPRKRLPKDLAIAFIEGMDARLLIQELRTRAASQSGLASFMKGLDDLATSISQVGQLAPIRVYRENGKRYIVETGERRWLAHLILFLERKDSTFSHIDAIVTPKRHGETNTQQTLQRRMAENVQRAEFSPIEMARGLAERIAQVLNENAEFTRSKSEEIVGAENGITARRVRQYLSLLKLCDQAQVLAQENGLTERALRNVLKFHEPHAQVQAIEKLIVGEHAARPVRNAVTSHNKRAESFLQSVLELARNKQEANQYKRVLQIHLKQNPRARVFLAQLLQPQKHTSPKRPVSKNPSPNGTRRVKARHRKHTISESPRLYERNSRRGRRHRR